MQNIPGLKAEFFKALGHPARIRVLEVLSGGEQTVGGLVGELDVEQPYLSQHLAVLRRAGFVVTRREGASVVYDLADPRIGQLLSVARDILIDLYVATGEGLRAS